MNRYALALIPMILLPLQAVEAASPEEGAVKKYITALTAGSKENVASAMCRTISNEAPEKQVLMRFLFGPEGFESDTANSEDQIKAVRKLIDLSKLNYEFVDTGPNRTAAVVKVSGDMREVNSWKTFERFVRERDRSNYAFVTLEDKDWRFCGFLTIGHAQKMAQLYNWGSKSKKASAASTAVTPKKTAAASNVKSSNELAVENFPESKIIDIDLSKLYPQKKTEKKVVAEKKVPEKETTVAAIPVINIDLSKLYPPKKTKIVRPKTVDLSLSKLEQQKKEQQIIAATRPAVIDINLGRLKQAGLYEGASRENSQVASTEKDDDKGEILYQDFTLSADKRWIVVASREDPMEAKNIATGFLEHFPSTQVIKTDNGWYAVVIGNLPSKNAMNRLRYFKETQVVPKDAFLSTGQRFLKRYWASKALIKAEKL